MHLDLSLKKHSGLDIFLVVGSKGQAYWSDIPSRASSQHSITEHKLIAFVEYLIDNIYVNIGDRTYRQCVGIPMGTDCAPLLANLFFITSINIWKNLIKNNITLARKFNHTMRYVDDLLTLNNSAFEQRISDTYPSELQLKRTTECPNKLSYLDQLTMGNIPLQCLISGIASNLTLLTSHI